jgi:hypothetical protein
MFVRQKRIGRYTYVYLIETVREDGQIKQRIIRNLRRRKDVERRGDLDRLVRSGGSPAHHPMHPHQPGASPHDPALLALISRRNISAAANARRPAPR